LPPPKKRNSSRSRHRLILPLRPSSTVTTRNSSGGEEQVVEETPDSRSLTTSYDDALCGDSGNAAFRRLKGPEENLDSALLAVTCYLRGMSSSSTSSTCYLRGMSSSSTSSSSALRLRLRLRCVLRAVLGKERTREVVSARVGRKKAASRSRRLTTDQRLRHEHAESDILPSDHRIFCHPIIGCLPI